MTAATRVDENNIVWRGGKTGYFQSYQEHKIRFKRWTSAAYFLQELLTRQTPMRTAPQVGFIIIQTPEFDIHHQWLRRQMFS